MHLNRSKLRQWQTAAMRRDIGLTDGVYDYPKPAELVELIDEVLALMDDYDTLWVDFNSENAG